MRGEDYILSNYEYYLPSGNIAQFPAEKPGSSRLMTLSRFAPTLQLAHAEFSGISRYLPKNSLVIANNSRVLQARLLGKRPGGGKAEFLLLTPLPLIQAEAAPQSGFHQACVECLLKPSNKIFEGQWLEFDNDLKVQVIQKGEFGRHMAILHWKGQLRTIFEKSGKLPLPPYIRREPEELDANRYQTIYAQKCGSIAAPTAGLHFTPQIRAQLDQNGMEWREITLYVGYGTFSPVRVADIRQHTMHPEYVEISPETASAIADAKASGRPVVAVGTTSLRALEGVCAATGSIGPFAGFINIFIYPGFDFKIVDGLITNFHLPASTLLMLVAAFAGRKRILQAYEEAIRNNYRFYSYGDAMLIY